MKWLMIEVFSPDMHFHGTSGQTLGLLQLCILQKQLLAVLRWCLHKHSLTVSCVAGCLTRNEKMRQLMFGTFKSSAIMHFLDTFCQTIGLSQLCKS